MMDIIYIYIYTERERERKIDRESFPSDGRRFEPFGEDSRETN